MSFLSPPHLLDATRWAGLRVGLLGGSFNPPHKGHVHISEVALQTLGLDVIWWLVTPANPLKDSSDLPPAAERMELCRAMTDNRQIVVTDIENEIGTNLSYKTVKALRAAFPRTEFVWITGMDIALTIHQWHNWRELLDTVATAHVARPPALTLIENCPLRMLRTQKHEFLERPRKASLKPGHTYWVMQRKMVAMSSSEIRDAGQSAEEELLK